MDSFKRLICFVLIAVLFLGPGAEAVDLLSIDEDSLTYDSDVDYMSLMIIACQIGSEQALIQGGAAELQRNLKISDTGVAFDFTSYFKDYETADEIFAQLKDYIAAHNEKQNAELQYVVTSTTLNCRQGPGTYYDKIDAFSYGTVLTLLEERDGWLKVTDGSITGWCSAEYLIPYDGNPLPASGSSSDPSPGSTSDSSSKPAYTEDDLYWLAVAINMEAGSKWLSDAHQLLVGNVILNRVANSNYPNTVYEVLQQRGQYPWATRGSYSEPTERALVNAKRLLEGERFCPGNVLFQSTVPQGSGIYTSIYDSTLGSTTYFCYQ